MRPRLSAGTLGLLLACAHEDPVGPGETGSSETTAVPTSGAASSTGDDVACVEPTPLEQASGAPSGFESCDNEAVHRAEAVACTAPITPSSCADNSKGGECTVASECAAAPFGSCQQSPLLSEQKQCRCVYGCRSDADCDDGRVCRCAGTFLGLFTECIRAECASDADCDGGLCVLSPSACEPGGRRLACLHAYDTCFDSSECYDHCVASGDSWTCDPLLCG